MVGGMRKVSRKYLLLCAAEFRIYCDKPRNAEGFGVAIRAC